ncbi:hypothetical protein TNCV_2180671 [Trichonephila clavipes]|uniref:Uncharacterized protein n=1 Tax=Trichonephila clavipes TaxID=2585209 RepID=A0A8X6VUU2_TRICX|nr:hypothetical protein TNCV_2180671 [Trichonephila clavipes]
MKLIITGDESWVYGYDAETKQQSSQWKTPGSPRPKKARPVRSKSCSLCFSMQMELFIMNSLPRTRQCSEQGILLGRHEEIKRGCSQKTTGVVGVLSLDASS